jgi:hypothetical protein
MGRGVRQDDLGEEIFNAEDNAHSSHRRAVFLGG